MERYINNLHDVNLKKSKIGESFENIGNLKRDYFLEISTGFNMDITKQIKAFNQVLEYYKPYILNTKELLDIFDKIEKVQYINAGTHKDEHDKWEYNKHLFIINNITFEYKTGVGINCNEKDKGYYNIYKLLFDAVYCLIDETNILQCYSNIDDFLEEMGYSENIKQIRKGEQIYRQIRENKEKLLKIFSNEDIDNIREYIEL